MCGSSPSRSTLNTNVITGLGMCKVCTGTRGKRVVNGSPTAKYLKCAGCFFWNAQCHALVDCFLALRDINKYRPRKNKVCHLLGIPRARFAGTVLPRGKELAYVGLPVFRLLFGPAAIVPDITGCFSTHLLRLWCVVPAACWRGNCVIGSYPTD